MADRSIAASDTFELFRTTYNSTAEDVGDIADLKAATGLIASSTDIVESIVVLNANAFDRTANITFTGNNTFTGTSTFAGLTFSSSGITYADGTTQTTAATTTGFSIAMAVALG